MSFKSYTLYTEDTQGVPPRLDYRL